MKIPVLISSLVMVSFASLAQQQTPPIVVKYDSTLKSYIISEVKVVGLSWEGFKHEFLTMKLKETPKIAIAIPPPPAIKIGGKAMPVRANPTDMRPEFHQELMGPISFLYNKFSKEAKDKKHTANFKKMMTFQERFYPALRQETQLPNDSIGLFMQEIKPNTDSIMELTDYEMREYIREKVRILRRRK